MEKSFKLSSCVLGLLAVFFLVENVTTAKFALLKEKNGVYSQDVVSIKVREKQLDCMAMNIYREAGHESFEGKVAVAQVVMNRVNSGKFAPDVCGVIYQKNVVMERVVFQIKMLI